MPNHFWSASIFIPILVWRIFKIRLCIGSPMIRKEIHRTQRALENHLKTFKKTKCVSSAQNPFLAPVIFQQTLYPKYEASWEGLRIPFKWAQSRMDNKPYSSFCFFCSLRSRGVFKSSFEPVRGIHVLNHHFQTGLRTSSDTANHTKNQN